ncbi:neuronal acetylcholine receptor subunit alpha-5-like isoform X2 [Pectinophora gossypiella]|uniref:neuronal acetylcholine receptor subunit alpha-5-like isoform X2 n=1 Tax=Pectinophora gossypiella TaxID=13191 RepID=UPI00214E598F|nr:neuronal acetylcholine receptor subunit alpha-5-like isoform X2 [Pectinophora gossypiella]
MARALGVSALALLVCGYGVGEASCACANTSSAAALDLLLGEYDRAAPPAPLVRVRLALDVRHAAVDDAHAAMRLLADFHMSWQDSRITWNASEWGCEWALTSVERLWRPDVALVNAAAARAPVEPLRARVTSAGAVSWVDRLDVAIPISMDLGDWPRDIQTGVFKFASREHTADEIDITIDLDDVQYATVFESGAWEIVTLGGAALASQATEAGARRVATWSLALRRRAPALAAGVHVAAAAALLLLLAAAIMPPDVRVPVAAAAAFTLAIWLEGAVWQVGGGSCPRAVHLLGALCGVSGAGAAAAALVARVARLAAPPPARLRPLLLAASRLAVLSPPPEGSEGECGTWVAAARLLDAALLAVLALALLVILCLYL